MSLRVWLPLDGTLENKGLDRDYDTPISNKSYPVWAAEGKIGSQSLYPTTTTSGVLSYSKTLSNAQSYSICAWIKSTDSATGSRYVIWTGSDSNSVGFGMRIASNGTVCNCVMFGTSIGVTINLNEWHHVVMAIDYSNLQFSAYLDGVFVNKKSYTVNTVSDQGFNIGWLRPSYYPFKGYINDIRIYDHCLSPKEVKEISQGLVLHYKLDGKIENLLPYNLTTDNYDIINYAHRTPGTISNEVYHVDGYQSETSADTSFGIRSKTFITLDTDTDYYLSFYCKCKAAGILYFATSGQGYTGLIDSSNTYYRPTSQFTLGTEYDGFVVLKLHTGSDTQYKIYIGFDGPNIWGVGSFMEFKHIALTTQKPNAPIIQRQNLLPVSAQRMTAAGTTSSNEYMNLCSILSIVDAYGLVPYTISFDIKSAVNGTFQLYGSYSSNPKYSWTPLYNIKTTSEWKRVTYTFTPRLNVESGTWAGCSVYGTCGSGAIVSIRRVKLELGTVATPMVGEDGNIIYDCSGYGNDGTITGSLSMGSSTPRYSASTNFAAVGDYISRDTVTSECKTASIWCYVGSSKPSSNSVLFADYNSKLSLGFYSSGTQLITSCSGTSFPCVDTTDIKLNSWNHLVLIHDGSTSKVYINGVLQTNRSNTNYWTHSTQTLMVASRSSGNGFVGQLSDFRMYATVLSDADIKELYDTAASIDDGGNLHDFECVEDDVTDEQILKTGIVKTDNFIEFNDKLKVLEDGSVFLQILHHNNPASNLFTVNNCWLNNTTNLYSALSLLKESGWFTSLSEYEFLICEKLTSTDAESQYRWKQTSNPSTSLTLSGYSVISGSPARPCGLMNKGTYAAMHNGSAWWVACGSYTAYQGGIPGVAGIVTTGYIDLYVRIPDEILKGTLSDFLKMYKKSIIGNQLIEK